MPFLLHLFFLLLSFIFKSSKLFKLFFFFPMLCSIVFLDTCIYTISTSLKFSFSFLTQEPIKFVFKLFFLTRELVVILDESISYVNEVFYVRLLLSSYPKWRRNNIFPHACFQLIKISNGWLSALLHSRLPLIPPLICTSYKFKNNMPKNASLTIFIKEWLH